MYTTTELHYTDKLKWKHRFLSRIMANKTVLPGFNHRSTTCLMNIRNDKNNNEK